MSTDATTATALPPEVAPHPAPARAAGAAPPDHRQWWLRLLVVIVVVGAALRVYQYASRPAYWHDEAALALNVFEKPPRELVSGPLDAIPQTPQAAPPLFLLAERGMYAWFGRSELGMRFVPLVVGVASLGLFAVLAWRALPPPAAALAAAMMALSDRLIAHANEAKQYAGDVMVCTALLLIAQPRGPATEGPATEGSTATARLARVSVAAAAGLWFSHPVAFVFGGISLALLPAVVREHGRRGWLRWAACNALVFASFLALYVVSIRTQQAGALYDYWASEFVPWVRPWVVPAWIVRNLMSICNYPLELAGPILLPLAVLGAWGLARVGRREWVAMLLAPLALVLLASAAHRYPFGGRRLTLFLAPMVFLLAAAGVNELRRIAAPRIGRWWLAVPAFLVGVALWGVGSTLVIGSRRGDIRPAVRYIQVHHEPGEPVYTTKTSELFTYWLGREPKVHFVGRVPVEPVPEPDTRGFWFVASYAPGRHERIRPVIESLLSVADQTDEFRSPGATAIRFELRDGPVKAAAIMTSPGAAPAASAPSARPLPAEVE